MNPRYSYYQKGSPFNEWHRRVDGLAAVDVDLMEVCSKCYRPLLLIEHAFDKGQTYKNCTAVMKLSRMSGVDAILILYSQDMKQFRVRKLTPTLGNFKKIKDKVLIRYLCKLHSKHRCI